MTTKSAGKSLSVARAALAKPMDYEAFLVKLGAKGQVNAEKHLAACEAEGKAGHAPLWRRMVCMLMTLAPHAVKISREGNLQFYVPDGRYRMQVFAIEDLRSGELTVYCADVLAEAMAAHLLRPADMAIGESRYVVGESEDTLKIDRLDGKSLNPAGFFKDMMGWNRKALRIALPLTASESQIEAVEALCALSVQGVGTPAPEFANRAGAARSAQFCR